MRTYVLVAACLLGVITAGLVYLYFSGKMRREPEPRAVVVAATYISPDTVISSDMIRAILVPERQLAKGAATNIAQVADMVTITAFQEGEQLVSGRLASKATAFGLPGIIPHGTRAMTIAVDAAGAVSGLLQPGDRVDVVACFVLGSDSVAKMIIQDVPLLAVNARVTAAEEPASGKDKKADTTKTSVTLAVTPQEAERLVAAQYKGKLKLGLRGFDDKSRVVTVGASTSAILGFAPPSSLGPRPLTPPAPARKPAPAPAGVGPLALAPVAPVVPAGAGPVAEGKTIRVIRGNQVEEVVVTR